MADEKRCPRCGEVRPLTEFFRNRARHDGHGVYCKSCQMGASKRSLAEYRARLFVLLGGPACRRCGIDDVRVLVFDHRNGGGRTHRTDAGSSYSVYRYIEKHPAEFQVLCFNCNHIERLERGESGKAYAAKVAAAGAPELVVRPLRWARDFDACTSCGTTVRRHHSGGLCGACLQEKRRRAAGANPRKPGQRVEKWSGRFNACLECGTSTTPYGGGGLCRNCYMRRWKDRRRLAVE